MSSSADQRPLFVYGTLCIPDVRNTLLRREVDAIAAELADAEVRRIRGQTYPTIVLQRAGRTARGMILHELSDAERRVLRGFEPPIYDLVEVSASQQCTPQPCLTFVHRGGLAGTDAPWAPAAFTGDERRHFLAETARASDVLWRDQVFEFDN